MKKIYLNSLFLFSVVTISLAQDPPPPDPAPDPAAPGPAGPTSNDTAASPAAEKQNKTRTSWLRVCSSSEDFAYVLDGNECHAGIWLKKPLHAQCVCGHGVWYIGEGYCDRNYLIVVANNGSCFPVDSSKPIHWVKLIGNPDSPFSPYYFASSRHLDVISENRLQGTPQEKLAGLRYISIGAINPQYNQEDLGQKSCIIPRTEGKLLTVNGAENGPKDDYELANMISQGAAKAFNIYYTEWMQGVILRDMHKFAVVKTCTNPQQYAYKIGVGYMMFLNAMNYDNAQPVNRDNVTHTCDQTCTADREPSPNVTNPSTMNPEDPTNEPTTTAPDENSTSPTTTTPRSRITTTLTPGPGNCIEIDHKWNKLTNKTLHGIQEQTKRMLMSQINYALFKHKGFDLNLTEYNLFQKSRRIFEKVCPKDEVPQPVLRGVLRMFRQLLNETQLNYPYFQRGDEEELNRINEALRTCFETTGENAMTFVYNEKKCPKKFLKIDIKNGNASTNASGWIPCDVRLNTSKHDYPVEIAWKIVMFTHYFCTPYFNEIGYDHSRYLTKMSEMFNRAILNRWYFHLNSYEAISFVFQAYNLTQIGQNIDRCVGAAHKVSNYTGWIKRPEYVQYCRDPEAHEHKNLTPEERKKLAKAKRPQKRFKGITGITKPLVDANGWNSLAYCLKKWSDPLVHLNYLKEADRRCKSAGAEIFWTDPSLNLDIPGFIPGIGTDTKVEVEN